MDQKIKNLWTAALRSGEYKQGKDNLLHEGKYCCLGVLSDLWAKEKGLPFKACRDAGDGFTYEDDYLPPVVQDWAGLPADPTLLLPSGGMGDITDLNDGRHPEGEKSFAELADLIDEQL